MALQQGYRWLAAELCNSAASENNRYDMNNENPQDRWFCGFLTPFKYFNANTVMFDKQIDTGFVALSVLLTVVCTAGSYYFFKKRDLYS